ncbi:Hypothetical_protein [Hexamita inflata]|uniref:Hypothetical_protein n=1 Tax=Hexamita inflata TaxID=28002 RepID=A0AA86QLA4_9EUKA|nr:Hypothetical protein HINF_LOCUS45626 [Hexamita inflata]
MYQILGTYYSIQVIAMIGINVNNATVNINQITFNPSNFKVGNGSSYLFGRTIQTKSTFVITDLAIILGNISNILVLGNTLTSNQDSDFYLFGGIISYIYNCDITVNNIIVDSYQQLNTQFISKSGILIGYIGSSLSRIIIDKVCFQQNMTSNTQKFNWFGLIGMNQGNISLHNAAITLRINGSYFNCIGIVGSQQLSLLAEIVNLKTIVSLISQQGQMTASIFGFGGAQNCTVYNTSLINSNINTNKDNIAGFIGYLNSNITIIDSTILQTNIQGLNQMVFGSENIGGFIGYINEKHVSIQNSLIMLTNISGSYRIGGFIGNYYQSEVQLKSSKVQQVCLNAFDRQVGIIVGCNCNIISIDSIAVQNYINGVLQTDCVKLLNIWSINGC